MNRHVSFGEMCDFLDAEPAAEKERARIRNHLDSCAQCSAEFARLGRTLNFCAELGKQKLPIGDLSPRILGRLRAHRGRSMLMKALPAVAASFFIVLGIGVFLPHGLDNGKSSLAQKAADAPESDGERVIGILRSHEADILRVTNGYVEGRIPAYRFSKLQKDLGGREVSYMLTGESSEAAPGSQWPSHLEEVGAGSVEPERERTQVSPVLSRYVIFKIYR